MKLHPYMTFNGTCREAFETYAGIFDGEVLFFQHYDEMPGHEDLPKSRLKRVMHGQVSLQGQVVMGSDTMNPADYLRPQGFQLQTEWEDPDLARDAFAALSEGGEILMPFEETFWSPGFGLLRDRFDIMWMVNVNGDGG